jgi:hypothetical protein
LFNVPRGDFEQAERHDIGRLRAKKGRRSGGGGGKLTAENAKIAKEEIES